jgi:hypothetical protein
LKVLLGYFVVSWIDQKGGSRFATAASVDEKANYDCFGAIAEILGSGTSGSSPGARIS